MRLRIKLASAVSAAVVATSVLAIGVSAASAAKPLLHPTSGTVTCTLSAKASLSPPLKNDWVHADHQDSLAEPDATVRALPDTTFTANNGAPTAVTTSAKGKGTCTGSFTGPEGSFPVSSVKLAANSTTGGTSEANCGGLVPAPPPAPQTTFTSTLTFKLSGASMDAITLTSSLAANVVPLGFKLTSVAGQVAGHPAATAQVIAGIADSTTFNALGGAASTSLAPSTSVCEAQLKFKKGVATLKAPKGLKKITIGGAGSALTLTF